MTVHATHEARIRELENEVDQLRPFAEEPERVAMSRGVQFPTAQGRVLAVEQELVRMREVLGRAITMLDSLVAKEWNRTERSARGGQS